MRVLHAAMTALLAFTVLVCTASPDAARAEVSEIRITYQPSIIYLPVVVMRHEKLIEKAGAAHGLPNLGASYAIFGGGGAAIDALLSGNVDILTTGVSNMLLLWDRTKGGVKGYAQSSATPLWLITTNPKVKTLRDLSTADKIAVPTVKISSQAILLQMAARKEFGADQAERLDQYTTTLAHPDAMASLASGRSGLDGHFSAPPFQQQEMKIPGAHVIATSTGIMGGPVSNALYFGLKKFHDENPRVVASFMQAAREAVAFIKAHPREACAMYAELSGDKTPIDELVDVIQQPGMLYDLTPVGTYATALHMADTHVMKTRPADWKDFFFAEAYDLPGN
jgi:NitT/TauT family transport system substrate-binding protein